MRIGCTHDRCLEQTVVLVYTHQSLCDEDYETEVILWCLARSMKQNTCICSEPFLQYAASGKLARTRNYKTQSIGQEDGVDADTGAGLLA